MRLISSPKDFFPGLTFAAIGALAIAKSSDYLMGSALQMGPGYFPRLVGIILVVLGLASTVRGVTSATNDPVERRAVEPVILIILGVFGFALLINRAGLVPAIFTLLLLSCFRRAMSKPIEVLAIFLILTGGAVVLFIYGFSMPFRAFGSS